MAQPVKHHNRSDRLRGSACGLCCTTIEDFSVTRGGHLIIDKIDLHIHCGEITALVGPNGAGKSTLLKAILGEIPHRGNLRYLDAEGQRSGKPRIGYVPQRLDFDPDSPVSVLDLFHASHSSWPVWLAPSSHLREKVKTMLARVQAEHLLDRRLGALSGGELQRVLLALALDPLPDLLLLDEPISGIDYKGMQRFYNIVADLKKEYDLSIILVSHDLHAIASLADRVVYLNRTVQCLGTPAEVLKHTGFLDAFGLNDFIPAGKSIKLNEEGVGTDV